MMNAEVDQKLIQDAMEIGPVITAQPNPAPRTAQTYLQTAEAIEIAKRLLSLSAEQEESFRKFLEVLHKSHERNFILPDIKNETSLKNYYENLYYSSQVLKVHVTKPGHAIFGLENNAIDVTPTEIRCLFEPASTKDGKRPNISDDVAYAMLFMAMSNASMVKPNKLKIDNLQAGEMAIFTRAAQKLRTHYPDNARFDIQQSSLTSALTMGQNMASGLFSNMAAASSALASGILEKARSFNKPADTPVPLHGSVLEGPTNTQQKTPAIDPEPLAQTPASVATEKTVIDDIVPESMPSSVMPSIELDAGEELPIVKESKPEESFEIPKDDSTITPAGFESFLNSGEVKNYFKSVKPIDETMTEKPSRPVYKYEAQLSGQYYVLFAAQGHDGQNELLSYFEGSNYVPVSKIKTFGENGYAGCHENRMNYIRGVIAENPEKFEFVRTPEDLAGAGLDGIFEKFTISHHKAEDVANYREEIFEQLADEGLLPSVEEALDISAMPLGELKAFIEQNLDHNPTFGTQEPVDYTAEENKRPIYPVSVDGSDGIYMAVKNTDGKSSVIYIDNSDKAPWMDPDIYGQRNAHHPRHDQYYIASVQTTGMATALGTDMNPSPSDHGYVFGKPVAQLEHNTNRTSEAFENLASGRLSKSIKIASRLPFEAAAAILNEKTPHVLRDAVSAGKTKLAKEDQALIEELDTKIKNINTPGYQPPVPNLDI